jgi:hypothetical protein
MQGRDHRVIERELLEQRHVELVVHEMAVDVAGEAGVDAKLALQLGVVAGAVRRVGRADREHRQRLPEHVVVI